MRNAGLEEAQAGIKIARRNINNLRNNKMISINFQSKLFSITVTQVYAPTTNAKEVEVKWFCEDLEDLLELTPKNGPFSSQGIGMQKYEVKTYLE